MRRHDTFAAKTRVRIPVTATEPVFRQQIRLAADVLEDEEVGHEGRGWQGVKFKKTESFLEEITDFGLRDYAGEDRVLVRRDQSQHVAELSILC